MGADVVKRERLLGTAAARDIPINNTRSRKRISYLERKAMAEAYIDEYVIKTSYFVFIIHRKSDVKEISLLGRVLDVDRPGPMMQSRRLSRPWHGLFDRKPY